MENKAERSTLHICRGLVIAMIAYPLLFLWQGLDFTDSGFHITNYSMIFKSPESIQYSFMYWLTDVIGGIWLLLFGKLGYIGIRIFGVLVLWASIYLTYVILKDYINRVCLLSGLLLVLIFSYNSTRIFEYNRLTAFFYTAAVLLMLQGLKRSRSYLVLLCGAVLGVNIFVRVSNVVGFAFIAAVVFHGYINRGAIKKQAFRLSLFTVGFAGGIGLTLAFMKLLGHYEYFMNTMRLTAEISQYSSASHNFKYLLKLLIKDHLDILKFTGVAFALAAVVLLIGKMTEKLKFDIYRLRYIVFVLLIPPLAYFFYHHDPYMFFYNIYAVKAVVGLMYFVLAAYITNFAKSGSDFRLAAFLGLVMLFVTPLGSDNGVYNAIFGMWIPGVFLFDAAVKLAGAGDITVGVHRPELHVEISLFMVNIRSFAQLLLVVFIVFSLVQGYRETFRDSYDRLSMRYPVNNSLLKGIYTTKERAALVNELLDAAGQYVDKDNYLLAFCNIPMIHYLTGARPYLYNAWPELYIYEQYRAALEKARECSSSLPVIIVSRINTSTIDWPKDHSPDFEDIWLKNSPTYADLMEFIKSENYSRVWANQYFEILKAE